MNEDQIIRKRKSQIRILFILYYFGENYQSANMSMEKVFESEVRIQKIDFLIRNPDYLAFELLGHAKENKCSVSEVKQIVKDIIKNKEPILRKTEMRRFLFGAYEDIDDVIGFLISIGFIRFQSNRSTALKKINKKYFVTDYAIKRIQAIDKSSPLKWYEERCNLIKMYFGDLTGTDLKAMQYKIGEYRSATYGEYIKDIKSRVEDEYKQMYGEELI